jgi:hypothetical protein
MTRSRQLRVLAILAVATLLLLALLHVFKPTVDGVTIRNAELHIPMDRLQQAERDPFLRWLAIDTVFAVIYTVLFTWGLRWLARTTRRRWLKILGRGLSWLVAYAIVFDLAENLILWVSVLIDAHDISPWLSSLVKLKWLSLYVFFGYVILWLIVHFRPPRTIHKKITSRAGIPGQASV